MGWGGGWHGGAVRWDRLVRLDRQTNNKKKVASAFRVFARTQPDYIVTILYSAMSMATFLDAAMSSACLSAVFLMSRMRTDVWSSAFTAFDARAGASGSSSWPSATDSGGGAMASVHLSKFSNSSSCAPRLRPRVRCGEGESVPSAPGESDTRYSPSWASAGANYRIEKVTKVGEHEHKNHG